MNFFDYCDSKLQYTIMGESFYSNSFVQAIKAKLSNPFKIKIIPIHPKYNVDFCYRFFWTDGKYDYSFIKSDIYVPWWKIPFHKGTIIKHKKNYAKGYMAFMDNCRIKEKQRAKYAEQYFKEEQERKKKEKLEKDAKIRLQSRSGLMQMKYKTESRFGQPSIFAE